MNDEVKKTNKNRKASTTKKSTSSKSQTNKNTTKKVTNKQVASKSTKTTNKSKSTKAKTSSAKVNNGSKKTNNAKKTTTPKTVKKETPKVVKEEVQKEVQEEVKVVPEIKEEPIKENNKTTEDVVLEAKENIIKEEKVKKEFFKDNFINNVLMVTLFTFAIEIIFRLISHFSFFNYATLRILISTFILSLIFTFLASLTKRKWLRNTIILVYIFLYTLYSWLQLGFFNFLGVYISFNTSSQFGAVTDYIYDFLDSFKLIYYVVIIPFVWAFIHYIFILRKKEYHKLKFNLKTLLIIPVLLVSGLLYYGTITLPFMQNKLQTKSNKYLFLVPDVPTVAVNQYGSVMFGVVDLRSYLYPIEIDENVFSPNTPGNATKPTREVDDYLDKLANSDEEKKYAKLNQYFANQVVTDYNDYTGMFEGKNVVVILMESVNEAIINPEYYPNFYKLYSEGWHWNNHYSPRNSCATGNNEFSAMTSLYSIYNTCTMNVYKNNTYYEAIFNLFNAKGYNTSSMHDFVEWYYKRKTSHPNMGSSNFYGADKLGIKTSGVYGEWPSDEEFFEKAFDILLNDTTDKPFMTWLTTVTSHQPYSVSSTYGDLYKDYFKGEGYSNSVSRYMSKLKVVDNAIGIMIDKLETAGKLDDTVIVMLADHYPYGLKKNQVAEMISHNLDDYDIEKTPFVIYNPSMSPMARDEYTSYINLLPTIANLMNLNYDPRLYMGTDLFSPDYVSRVVFADGSWKNADAYYNASTSETKYYGDVTYTVEELQNINNMISLKMSMSTTAIKNNYFSYLEKTINKLKEEEQVIVDETIPIPEEEQTEIPTDNSNENAN